SHDEGHSWVARSTGLSGEAFFVQALAGDPTSAGRVWVGGADRIMRSDDSGLSWQPVGQPLPDQQTDIHGVSANADGNLLLVSTHRGLYFSDNAGATWTLLVDNLPG